MKQIILFFSLVLFSNFSFATCDSISCSGMGSEVLTAVYPNEVGDVYLTIASEVENLNCTPVANHITLKASHPAFKVIYSTLLTALATDKMLRIKIVSGSSGCQVLNMQMTM